MQADQHLARDPRLAPLVAQFDLAPLPEGQDLYSNLVRTIIYQQLSGKAAQTIHGRFLALFPDGYPHAEQLLAYDLDTLRSVGVSRQKAGYLHHVANHWRENDWAGTDWTEYDNEALIKALTAIKGVGQWTAEMLLMFTLRRPDVLPLDDLAIRSAMQELYGVTGRGRALQAELTQIAEPWRPYRSRACRYLWAWKNVK